MSGPGLRRLIVLSGLIAPSSPIPFRLKAQTFEVASIRPHEGPLQRMMHLTISGTRIRMEGYSVLSLVMEAYQVRNFQISLAAVPRQDREIREVYYDIDARVPGESAPRREDLRRMIRGLLADRFKLVVHRESRDMPVYALLVGREGPKLKSATEDGECSVHVGVKEGRNYEQTFSDCPIGTLAEVLENVIVERPVVDKTALNGRYDFRLVITPESRSRNEVEPGDIDAFVAVRELGLRLSSQKERVGMIAIDSVGKPTEN